MSDAQKKNILITRPYKKAVKFAAQLEAQGVQPMIFPTLEIQPIEDTTAIEELCLRLFGKPNRLEPKARLPRKNIAIFVSAHAVSYSAKWCQYYKIQQLCKIVAVGEGTVSALTKQGMAVDWYPAETFSSEGILALPGLQDVAGRNVIIFAGHGGRELLQKTLEKRGAVVHMAYCYKRTQPKLDSAPITKALQHDEIDKIMCTSHQSLVNLLKMLDRSAHPLLKKVPLVVMSERMACLARELGFTGVIDVATKSTEEALLVACTKGLKQVP